MNHNLTQLHDLSIDRARLQGGDVRRITNADNARETAVHILIGTIGARATINGRRVEWHRLGERDNVFDAPPTVLYLGTASIVEVWPESRTADCLISQAVVSESAPPAVIRPGDVTAHYIGEGHYWREVREVIGGSGPALRLRIGETINPPGKWSSWPPHSFDHDLTLAPKFEEVFYYWLKPVIPGKDCEAYQRRRGVLSSGETVDDMIAVKSGDSAILPLGFHPIAAGLDCSLCYCWTYISPVAKQYAQWTEDGGYYA